jgi:hypothetical protein
MPALGVFWNQARRANEASCGGKLPMRMTFGRCSARSSDISAAPAAHSTTFGNLQRFTKSHVEEMPALSKTRLRSESASGVNCFEQEIVAAVIFA